MKEFVCNSCQFYSHCDYFGRKPPFFPRMVFLEEAYVIRDPFCPEPRPVFLGAHCVSCKEAVCPNCSVFYGVRFCLSCANKTMEALPDEVQKEVSRRRSQTIQQASQK
mmetsp:Transcript_21306/g.36588  ORF Transcript_21306/g.36588 Transcript_21306/m.36588 type:complete len:108 (-) Transcript_21306:725-1048(-)